jgi:hypothetical protein
MTTNHTDPTTDLPDTPLSPEDQAEADKIGQEETLPDDYRYDDDPDHD